MHSLFDEPPPASLMLSQAATATATRLPTSDVADPARTHLSPECRHEGGHVWRELQRCAGCQ